LHKIATNAAINEIDDAGVQLFCNCSSGTIYGL